MLRFNRMQWDRAREKGKIEKGINDAPFRAENITRDLPVAGANVLQRRAPVDSFA